MPKPLLMNLSNTHTFSCVFLQIPKIGKKHKGKLDGSARSKELTAEERQAENK